MTRPSAAANFSTCHLRALAAWPATRPAAPWPATGPRRSTGSRAQNRTATCSSSLPDSDATLAGARTKALATCTAAQDTLLAQHKTMTRGHGPPAPPVPAHAPAYCQAHLRLATRRAPSADMTARDTAQACTRHRDLLYSAQACAPHPRRLSSNPQPARAQPPRAQTGHCYPALGH
jgi:hypothetical protein